MGWPWMKGAGFLGHHEFVCSCWSLLTNGCANSPSKRRLAGCRAPGASCQLQAVSCWSPLAPTLCLLFPPCLSIFFLHHPLWFLLVLPFDAKCLFLYLPCSLCPSWVGYRCHIVFFRPAVRATKAPSCPTEEWYAPHTTHHAPRTTTPPARPDSSSHQQGRL